jgi:autotransporter-associated beta strand protein
MIQSLVSELDVPLNIDLGGHQLTVGSGGIIFNSARSADAPTMGVDNGRLTAGVVQGDSELILMNTSGGSRVNIGAAIVDSGDRSTGLVKFGYATVELSGQNTYSGPTYINEGDLRLMTPESFPAGGDLNLDGGRLRIQFEDEVPLKLGTLRLTNLGELGEGCCRASGAAIDAERYEVESGLIGQPMVGDGPLVKTSLARLDIRHDRPDYSGEIIIHNGLLVVGHAEDDRTGRALGTGPVMIHDGALIVRDGSLRNDITLSGGALAPQNEDRTFLGAIDVVADSTIFTMDGLYQPDGPWKITYGQGPDPRNVRFAGPVSLRDGTHLEVIGPGDVTFASGLDVGAGSRLTVEQGSLEVQRTIRAMHRESSLDIDGLGASKLDVSVEVGQSRSLSVSIGGEMPQLEVTGSGNSLAGGGTLLNSIALSGQAALRPGDQVGKLTLADELVLGQNTVYEWEINDASGVPGATSGWDIVGIGGTLHVESIERRPTVIEVIGTDEQGERGTIANFDPQQPYQWLLITADTIDGFGGSKFQVDASAFAQDNPVAEGARFHLTRAAGDLTLHYDPFGFDTPPLNPGDANRDFVFDQLDLVQVQIASKYLSEEPATWGEGDWDGAPGGSEGEPPAGDGRFNQFDIIAALNAGIYLTGPYAAVKTDGAIDDGKVDLLSVPEPKSALLLGIALVIGVLRTRRADRIRR